MLIYLIGYMSSGKTTIGRQLAKRLKYGFQDTDAMIEHKYRVNISRIFEKYGEDVFRRMEHEILQETAECTHTVISTGGGLPCYKENMDFINSQGVSVYIKLPPVHLCQRLKKSKQRRPLVKNLHKKNLQQFVEEQLNIREVYYNRANIVFDPYTDNIDTLVNKITSLDCKL